MYNNGFLPTISDTRPLTGARRVIARVYDFYQLMPSGNVGKLTVPTQEYSEGEAPNSSEIWGSAVATIWNQLLCRGIQQIFQLTVISKAARKSIKPILTR
jgi:hypothetical protein